MLSDCGCSAPTTLPVSIPGGVGENAFSTITASFTVPSDNGNVGVTVANSGWVAANQFVYIEGAGHFEVTSKVGLALTLIYRRQSGDAAPGTIIASGATITPAGRPGEQPDSPLLVADGGTGATTASGARTNLNGADISAVASITDNSTGSAGSTIAAGTDVQTIPIFVNLAQITATTIFNYTPGFRFKILAISFSAEIAVTTAAKAATITPAVNGSGITGGALALTSANCTPKGTNIAGSTVTAGNTGTAAQTLSLVASAVTAFSEGTGWILLRVQNLDGADSVASLSSKVNSLLSAVKP